MSFASRQFAKSWINHYSRKDTNHHIKGSDSAANRRTLVVVPFSVVIDDRLGDGRLDTFTTMADIELDLNTAANWDTVTPTNYAAYLAYQTYADRIVEDLPGIEAVEYYLEAAQSAVLQLAQDLAAREAGFDGSN